MRGCARLREFEAEFESELEGLHKIEEFGGFGELETFSAAVKGGVVAQVTVPSM